MKPPRVSGARLAMAALLGLCLLATVAVRPLILPDEGRYVGVALEMLRSGDWLVPTLDGLPYFHKPPLFYWITASAMAVGGVNLLTARAATLAGGLATLLWVGWFARRWLGDRAAFWTLWMLATMPMFFVAAQFANLDLLVAACITGAIVSLGDALLRDADDDPAKSRMLLVGWLMMALGVLAKGLIGCVLPLAVVGGWLLWQHRVSPALWAALRRLFGWPGVMLFGMVALPWFAIVQMRHPGFFDYFVVQQHVERFAARGFNNEQPIWFYAPVVAGLTLPWFVFLRPAARSASAVDSRRLLRSLAWWWLGVILVFFSLPRSKLVGYVLPALPAIALLVADAACNRADAFLGAGRRLFWTAACATLLCLVGSMAVTHTLAGRDHAAIARALDTLASRGEPVYALETQPYDLGYYLQVRRPIVLIADWTDPAIAQRDNWRKELADAARFAPAHAREMLLTRAEAQARWCSQPVNWVIAGLDSAQHDPALKGLQPVSRSKAAGLWRLDRMQLERADACG